jgi:uncharacterized membrane protein
MSERMSPENPHARRVLVWSALLFSMLTLAVSWWHWWTFQYGSFDLAFYVQALWLALRGKWMVSLLNVPLLGNHAEPIVFLFAPLFALCPHPMLFVVVQTLAFATMPFTAYRIGQRLELEPKAALLLALVTLITPATFSIGIYEFHPEALAAPLLLLLIEARMAGWRGRFWFWFVVLLSVKENMAALLIMYCGVFAVLEWKRGRAWLIAWNLLPMGLAMAWLLFYGKVISPALNAGNVDYLQLYEPLGTSPGDILGKFFTEPHRVFGALRASLTEGNLLPALLLPLLLLPLFRPRWLLIASPLLAQHLLSWRSSEWSLGAHYPAPFLALFWVAATEALARLRVQTAMAAVVLLAAAVAHFRFGEVRALMAELPALPALLEEREWKARMIAGLAPDAAVIASEGFLSHLATREKLVSVHHILKGLKTLSAGSYVPPASGDAVVIDYADVQTFSVEAGFYHPTNRTRDGRIIASSDRLLHEVLRQQTWKAKALNSVTLLTRGTAPPAVIVGAKPIRLDEQTTLRDLQIIQVAPGVLRCQMAWEFGADRKTFPWMMLVLTDGRQLYPFLRGACAPEAGAGPYAEEWQIVFPASLPAGEYGLSVVLYDNALAAWERRLPPNDMAHALRRIDLGNLKIQPGQFTEASP